MKVVVVVAVVVFIAHPYTFKNWCIFQGTSDQVSFTKSILVGERETPFHLSGW